MEGDPINRPEDAGLWAITIPGTVLEEPRSTAVDSPGLEAQPANHPPIPAVAVTPASP